MKLLVCDMTCKMVGVIHESGSVHVNSTVKCLNRAIIDQPDAVVVRFVDIAIREREALIELCGALKQNPYTKDIGIIALLCSKHRAVMEHLRDVGVEYVQFIPGVEPSHRSVEMTMKEPEETKDRLNVHLEVLCPYLRYSKIDSRHEMTVCGAYLDRMVLGGHRLREICETREHLHCEYFLNPK